MVGSLLKAWVMRHLAAGSLTWLRSGVHGDLIPLKFGKLRPQRAMDGSAVRQGIRSDNPVHGIVRFAEGRRQRRLSNRMLGMALSKSRQEKVWQPAVAATWLMILTGWRRGEVLGLRWSEVDLPRRTARLVDTKTGASLRPLSIAACGVIQSQPMDVPAGDAVGLVAEQAGDGRLAIAEIGRKTGEAMAQHMRRDIGWQITQRSDPHGGLRHGVGCCQQHDGSGATPVAASAARWTSRVGRIHLLIGVFVPRAMAAN